MIIAKIAFFVDSIYELYIMGSLVKFFAPPKPKIKILQDNINKNPILNPVCENISFIFFNGLLSPHTPIILAIVNVKNIPNDTIK